MKKFTHKHKITRTTQINRGNIRLLFPSCLVFILPQKQRMEILVKNKITKAKVREVRVKRGQSFRNNPEDQGTACPVRGVRVFLKYPFRCYKVMKGKCKIPALSIDSFTSLL